MANLSLELGIYFAERGGGMNVNKTNWKGVGGEDGWVF